MSSNDEEQDYLPSGQAEQGTTPNTNTNTNTNHQLRSVESRERIQGHTHQRRSLAEVQLLVATLFDKYVLPAASPQDQTTQSIAIYDLQDLLAEFERHRHERLLDDEALKSIQDVSEANPSLRLTQDDLVNLVTQIQGIASPQHQLQDAQLPTSDMSSTDDDDDDDDGEGSDSAGSQQNILFPAASRSVDSTSPVRSTFTTPNTDASPYSATSEDPDSTTSSMGSPLPKRRQKTTSDPSASPHKLRGLRGSSEPPMDFERPKPKRDRRVSGDDREVLRGKGKQHAPPTAWVRAKPPAFHSRRMSDVSASTVAGGGGDSGRPSDLHLPPNPRSVSSGSIGFQFPRAKSPGSAADAQWLADERKYEARRSVGGGSSRAGSPPADAGGGGGAEHFQPFSLSDATELEELGERTRTLQTLNDELQRANDEMRSRLASKTGDQEQHIIGLEQSCADLEKRVEGLQEEIQSRRKGQKDDEHRIHDLEVQVTIMEHQLEGLKKEKRALEEAYTRQKDEIEELQAEGDRMHKRLEEHTDTISSLTALKADNQREHEAEKHNRTRLLQDMAAYKEQLEHVPVLEERLHEAGLQMAGYRDRIEALQAELDAARAGPVVGGSSDESGIPSPIASLSRRLGAELARSTNARQIREVQIVEDDEEEGESAEDGEQHQVDNQDPDVTDDSYVETFITRRKRRSSRKLEMVSAMTQTVGEELVGGAGGGDGDLPTYAQAALEESIIARLHPSCGKTTTAPASASSSSRHIDVAGASTGSSSVSTTDALALVTAAAAKTRAALALGDQTDADLVARLEELSHELGMRCTVLESRAAAAAASQSSRPRRSRRSSARGEVGLGFAGGSLQGLLNSFLGTLARPGGASHDGAPSHAPPHPYMNSHNLIAVAFLTIGLLVGSATTRSGGAGGGDTYIQFSGGLVEELGSFRALNALEALGAAGVTGGAGGAGAGAGALVGRTVAQLLQGGANVIRRVPV